MTMPTGDPELDEFRRLQEEEYGEWVAVGPIYAGNALAYPEGGAVPKSNVERHSYDKMGLVVKRTEWEKRLAKEAPPTEDERLAAQHAAALEQQQISDAGQDEGGTAANASKPRQSTRSKSTADGE